MPLASVKYGKYTTRIPDVVTYGFYECFSCHVKYPCPYNNVYYYMTMA